MENYLVHHGILGQKWGVRRYQNPDGTLTEAGKQRLSSYKNKAYARTENSYERNHAYGFYGMNSVEGLRSLRNKKSKLEEKGLRQLEKGNTKGYSKTSEKLALNAEAQKILEAGKAFELEYVKNMTWEQMTDEKQAVAKAYIQSTLLSGAISALTPITYVEIPDGDSIRTGVRMKNAGKD